MLQIFPHRQHLPDDATDGQLLRYDLATGEWVPINPVGQSELASATNTTGTPTAISAAGNVGTVVVIPGTSLVVPASAGRPVTIFYSACFAQTTAGDGMFYLSLYETTSGAVLRDYSAVRLPNSTNAALNLIHGFRAHSLGVVSSTRTFELRANLHAPTSNSPAGSVQNTGNRSTIAKAFAG